VDEFKTILHDPVFRKHFGEIEAPRLSRPPKGFPPDFEDIGLLQYQYYSVAKAEPDSAVIKPSYMVEIGKVFRALMPFNRFLNEAIKEM
jgi:uncharacterized protein (DUF2461 family)